MKKRRKAGAVPGKGEILGGGFVLTILATVAIMRGGPDVTRAAVPPAPAKQIATQPVSQPQPQPMQQTTTTSLYNMPLPQALPPKPLTAQPAKSTNATSDSW